MGLFRKYERGIRMKKLISVFIACTVLCAMLVAFTGCGEKTAEFTTWEAFFEKYYVDEDFLPEVISMKTAKSEGEPYITTLAEWEFGPKFMLHKYEPDGDNYRVLSSCEGQIAKDAGISMSFVKDGEKYVYFGMTGATHLDPSTNAEVNLNWNSLKVTDENGKTAEIEMTANAPYLFVLSAPLKDFQIMNASGSALLDYAAYTQQGYSIAEKSFA